MVKLLFLLALMIIPITFYGLTEAHEDAHSSIGKTYGCLEDEVTNFVIVGSWKCLESREISGAEFRDSQFLHKVNDIVGYHSISFLAGLWGLVLFIFILLEVGRRSK